MFSNMTVQDLLSYANISGSKKIDTDAVLPFIILPLLLLVATLSLLVTVLIMIFIAMAALYIVSRPRKKNRSPFFFSWTLSSALYMFLIFELEVMGLLQVTQLENLIFLLLLICTWYFFSKMKCVSEFELAGKDEDYSPVLTSDSHYCQICQLEISDGIFHSIWWDCCVLKPNYGYFLAGHAFALFTIIFGVNLGLTTVCGPDLFIEPIFWQQHCSDAYEDFDMAFSFVMCIYGLGYTIVITLVLLHQLFVYIPKYSKSQWKKIRNGLSV